MNTLSVTRTSFHEFLIRHIWWIGTIGVLIPLIYIFADPIPSTAAYLGTTGIWKIVEKLLDLV